MHPYYDTALPVPVRQEAWGKQRTRDRIRRVRRV
jgi:hypothetical protein